MKTPPQLRWPKGPFPERYRFPAVEARLEGAWASREEAMASLTASLEPFGPSDPWVRLFRASERADAEALASIAERARGVGVTAFSWMPSRKTRGEGAPRADVIGFVPTIDPPDAVSAFGVAGLAHGISMAAIVRFLAALPGFASFRVVRMGEEFLALALTPKNDDSLLRIAHRVRHVCPPLARAEDVSPIVDAVRATGLLEMDWA